MRKFGRALRNVFLGFPSWCIRTTFIAIAIISVFFTRGFENNGMDFKPSRGPHPGPGSAKK